MADFTVETTIDAPAEQVWEALADIGSIYKWNPGVVSSYLTAEKGGGIGAARHCDLDGKNYLKEEVVEWDAGKSLTMRIVETNLPFKAADICFSLRADNGKTLVSVTPVYDLKFGVVGKMLDAAYVRNNYKKGMVALLKGLKKYVERGEGRPSNKSLEPTAS